MWLYLQMCLNSATYSKKWKRNEKCQKDSRSKDQQASFSWKINFTSSRFREKVVVVHLQSCFTIFSWLQICPWVFRVIQLGRILFDVEISVDIFWSLLQCVGKKWLYVQTLSKEENRHEIFTFLMVIHGALDFSLPLLNFCSEGKKGFEISQEMVSLELNMKSLKD